ncbi:hypothetical protein CLU90_3297 [Janthinobacterium sp. 67]|uniref:hypothetical protein n=1 Tax=Janthinobacterium sp. 67 TaxID=2035207 RepID=UPI000C23D3D9|nr:hypothetical protein [Janthinobacterium sp. 67]PJJ20065.1 hypothetical protein CLU90_3297 [Janthinobacterium sp. 67]
MMHTRYSPTTGNFYPFDLAYPNGLPADVIEVSQEDFAAVLQRPPGHSFAFLDGELAISAPEPEPYAQVAQAYLDSVRTKRDQILNRLSGIGFAAVEEADQRTVQAVLVTRQALLDITEVPAVLAATHADALKQAVNAAYQHIVAQAPAALLGVFPPGEL